MLYLLTYIPMVLRSCSLSLLSGLLTRSCLRARVSRAYRNYADLPKTADTNVNLFLLSSFQINTRNSMRFSITFSPTFWTRFRGRLGTRVSMSLLLSTFCLLLPLDGIFSLVSFPLLRLTCTISCRCTLLLRHFSKCDKSRVTHWRQSWYHGSVTLISSLWSSRNIWLFCIALLATDALDYSK